MEAPVAAGTQEGRRALATRLASLLARLRRYIHEAELTSAAL